MFQTLLALTMVAIGDSDPGAMSRCQLLKIVRAREQITSYEVKVGVHYTTFKQLPKMAGNHSKFHCWFQSADQAFRMDTEDTKSQVDGLPTASRFAYDGVTYRLINDVYDAKFPIYEFTNGKPRTAVSNFDARIVGVYPSSFMALSHYSLKDVERIVTASVSWSRDDTSDGFREVYKHRDSMNYIFYYSKDGLPIRYEFSGLEGASPYRYGGDLGYDVSRANSFSMPSKVSFHRYDGDTLTIDELWEIEVVQINQPVDRSIYTWAALSPNVGVELVVNRERQPGSSTVWNGSAFEQVADPPKDQLLAAPASQRFTSRTVFFVGLNIMIVTLVVYRLLKRRADSADTNVG